MSVSKKKPDAALAGSQRSVPAAPSSEGSAAAAFAHHRIVDRDAAEAIDLWLRGLLAQATGGLSPIEPGLAATDWLSHLAVSPGKALALAEGLARRGAAAGAAALEDAGGADTAAASRRMSGPLWRRLPFSLLARGHQQALALVREATDGVPGVSPEHQKLMRFLAGQAGELLSPANFPLTNPEVLSTTLQERGANFLRGARNLVDDRRRKNAGVPLQGRERFRVGREIAATPGKVVYRNELIELIQYAPTTAQVATEPVLIVPAWIMKYYILDLSPDNSLVRYLVSKGKTVFTISWKNPRAADRDRGMNDYLDRGVAAALDAVSAICDGARIHATGYCLGGTLLSIAAARMARDGDDRLQTLTTFASQVDFRDGGDIRLYLGDSMVAFVEALMERRGFLPVQSMINAWTSLRVADLVYEPAVQRYLLGKDRTLTDLLAWNEDGTRMPARMHSEYLRRCYVNNDLAENRYRVDGQVVSVADIRVPAFVLGTVTDHVAPWKSVYRALGLMHNEITFVLTTGGHNAGIVSGPEHPRRRYRQMLRPAGGPWTDPDDWAASAGSIAGSWWPAWNAWLDEHSSGRRAPPPLGSAKYQALADAPGDYVLG